VKVGAGESFKEIESNGAGIKIFFFLLSFLFFLSLSFSGDPLVRSSNGEDHFAVLLGANIIPRSVSSFLILFLPQTQNSQPIHNIILPHNLRLPHAPAQGHEWR